jgi:hypothetical protein
MRAMISRSPGAAQRAAVRCRPGVQGQQSKTWTPDQRRTVPLRFTLRRIRGTLPRYFAAESLAICAKASCTVVMNWAGKMMVEFFSTEISAIVCRVRS